MTTLDALIAAGTVWVDDGEYVGRASDGTEVSLGYVGDEPAVARYLAANPTPERW